MIFPVMYSFSRKKFGLPEKKRADIKLFLPLIFRTPMIVENTATVSYVHDLNNKKNSQETNFVRKKQLL